jgi:uncharacterized protein (DUF433 family)
LEIFRNIVPESRYTKNQTYEFYQIIFRKISIALIINCYAKKLMNYLLIYLVYYSLILHKKIMSGIVFKKHQMGSGIYTIPDIAKILNYPQHKVRRHVKDYWDDRLGKKLFNETYSWKNEKIKAVNFYVLIELYTCFLLRENGASTQSIMKAREIMAKELNTPFPFASHKVLLAGRKIVYELEDLLVSADGSKQINIAEIIREFAKNIDFDKHHLAIRFWPKGKTNSIVVDPHHQFGQPIINGTNITAEGIFSMYESSEPIEVISILFDITQKQVMDAVNFYKSYAA